MNRPGHGSAFFASALEEAPDPIVIADENGSITHANHAARSFYGAENPSPLLELPIDKLLPEWVHLPATCRGFSTMARLADGTEKNIALSLNPITTPSFDGTVAIFRDSSEARAQTARLEFQEDELRALVRHRDLDIASLRSELSAAAKILEDHLPSGLIPGVETSWIFQPCKTLGGDMLQFRRHENSLLISVLDVSGHGIAASLLALGLARGLSLDRGRGGCVLSQKGTLRQPKDVVTRLNQESRILFESGLFVTLVFGILDLATGELCFTCAGHPMPIRVWQGQASQLEGAIDPPLGVDQDTRFRESKVQLRPGELAVFFTDGVTESRSPDGEFYGEDRLLALLSQLPADEAHSAEKVRDSLWAFQQRREAVDDVTVVGVRYRRLAPKS